MKPLNQLLKYQVYLKTPPLLIVSSFHTIRIQTNFPGMETVRHIIPVPELDSEGPPRQAPLGLSLAGRISPRPNLGAGY